MSDREDRGGQRDDAAGDRGHHVRGVPLGVDAAQPLGQQAVAAHDEEDARLAEQQHEDHRGQCEERGNAEHVADLREPDLPQHVGQRLVRADQRGGIFGHGALPRQRLGPGREGHAARAHDWLAADRADRPGGNEDVEHGAEQERAYEADRHVALRIARLFRRGRDRVEADVGEEDRCRRTDRTDAGAPSAEHACG